MIYKIRRYRRILISNYQTESCKNQSIKIVGKTVVGKVGKAVFDGAVGI